MRLAAGESAHDARPNAGLWYVDSLRTAVYLRFTTLSEMYESGPVYPLQYFDPLVYGFGVNPAAAACKGHGDPLPPDGIYHKTILYVDSACTASLEVTRLRNDTWRHESCHMKLTAVGRDSALAVGILATIEGYVRADSGGVANQSNALLGALDPYLVGQMLQLDVATGGDSTKVVTNLYGPDLPRPDSAQIWDTFNLIRSERAGVYSVCRP